MKPVLAAALMFCAIWFLTRDVRAAAIAMAVPPALCWLRLAPSFAYLLTALAITAAVASLILPEQAKLGIAHTLVGGAPMAGHHPG